MAASLPRPSFPSDSPRNPSVGRRCSGPPALTLKRSRAATTLHFCRALCCQVIQTFSCQRPCMRHFLRGGRTGHWQRSQHGAREGGRMDPAYSVLRPGGGGFSRAVKTSGDRSCLQWCLASYNLQKAHPFAEVCRSSPRGEGGEADYSDTYRNGGLRCLLISIHTNTTSTTAWDLLTLQ